jgi:hypothetical protein
MILLTKILISPIFKKMNWIITIFNLLIKIKILNINLNKVENQIVIFIKYKRIIKFNNKD